MKKIYRSETLRPGILSVINLNFRNISMLCAGIKTQKSALLSDEYEHFELSLRKRDVHRSSVSFHDFLYRRNTDSVRRGVGFIGDKALSSHPDPVAF